MTDLFFDAQTVAGVQPGLASSVPTVSYAGSSLPRLSEGPTCVTRIPVPDGSIDDHASTPQACLGCLVDDLSHSCGYVDYIDPFERLRSNRIWR